MARSGESSHFALYALHAQRYTHVPLPLLPPLCPGLCVCRSSIDVQGRVQMMAGSNGGLVAVNNATMGGDPAPGVGKVLHLLYTHNGVQVR